MYFKGHPVASTILVITGVLAFIINICSESDVLLYICQITFSSSGSSVLPPYGAWVIDATGRIVASVQILKIDDQLKLQELNFFYKYRHGNVPAYLLNRKVITNYNIHSLDTRKATNIPTSIHEFAKKCLLYNLPQIILHN